MSLFIDQNTGYLMSRSLCKIEALIITMSRDTILLAEDHNLSVRIMRVMNYILKFSDKTSVDLASVIGLLDY